MEEKNKFTPLLPYDGTIGQNFSMYDKMPYYCDRDLCHPNIIMSTGNIVKYYTYNLEDDIIKIGENIIDQ